MRIEFALGNGNAAVILPAGVVVDYITPKEITAIDDSAGAVARAFSQPIDALPLADVIQRDRGRGAERDVLLVVSDLTRGGGSKEIIPLVVDYLESLGTARSDIRILVARGTHRKLTKEEKQYFKSDELRTVHVEEHDCDDASKMSALLLTKRGTPVRVNRLVKSAGLVILISPVSFHYFAGFGGGRKLILPGAADRAAILANHRLSLEDDHPVRLHPECRCGNLDGNPVSDDMDETLAALKNIYALNYFGDTRGRIVYVNAGDATHSHLEACEIYSGVHRVSIGKPYDIAIASCGGYPYDMNLVQAHKALKNAAGAVAPGGTILFYAECSEGVGSESLSRALAEPRDEFLDNAYRDYGLNNQTAVSLLTLTERYRVTMVTDLDDDTLTRAGIERCSNAEACLAGALEAHGAKRVAVIPYGSQTLPLFKKE